MTTQNGAQNIPEGESDFEMSPKKECGICFNEIHKNANKCTHCDSYLDWRKYFQFNTVVLSLLVALISVITTSSPIIKSIITPTANVKFSYLNTIENKIRIVATNTGKHPAVIKQTSLKIKQNENPRIINLKWNDTKNETVINPNKWLNLTLMISDLKDISFKLNELKNYDSCKIVFLSFDLNHIEKEQAITIDCKKLAGEK